MSPTLLVVQHVAHEGPDLIADLAQERRMQIDLRRPSLGDPLPDPDECGNTIALVLGGPMGANDHLQPGMDWLQRELDWLTCWHQRQKPVLGICLGAQLLAMAAGGSVEQLQVGQPEKPLKEVGFGAIHWVVDPTREPLLQGLNPSETVLHWHGDRIRLPSDATLLGSSLHCKEQVFRIKRHAIGLQCHLEISGSALESWITADRSYVVNAMGADGPEQLNQDWKHLSAGLEKSGRKLFTNVFDQLQT